MAILLLSIQLDLQYAVLVAFLQDLFGGMGQCDILAKFACRYL
jgi:hypothetical protein